jgi:hypothetical protein
MYEVDGNGSVDWMMADGALRLGNAPLLAVERLVRLRRWDAVSPLRRRSRWWIGEKLIEGLRDVFLRDGHSNDCARRGADATDRVHTAAGYS